MSDLCYFAQIGFVCPDDICRGCDVTLCGFDKDFYERELMSFPDYDDPEDAGPPLDDDEEAAYP